METKTPGGVTGKGFLPGQSGNPGGRPRGLAANIREATSNGEEIIDLLTAVMRGDKMNGKLPRLDHRIEACRLLLDRGWGRPGQATEREFGGPVETKAIFDIPHNFRDPIPPQRSMKEPSK